MDTEAQDDLKPLLPEGIGARLKGAREAAGWNIDDVSRAIKLAPRQIEALESDDYASLNGATFARGFLRNYALHLGLNADDLLAMLDARHVRAVPQLQARSDEGGAMPGNSARRRWALPMGALMVPVLVAVVLYVVRDLVPAFESPVESALPMTESAPPSTPSAPLPADDPGAVAGAGAESPAPDMPGRVAPVLPEAPGAAGLPSVTVAPNGAPSQAVVASPAASAPVAVPDAAPASRSEGARRLVFEFRGDAWVEVRDGNGRILLSQLNKSGSRHVLDAKPPFSLVIGNARVVSLRQDDQAVDLEPHIRVDVARLRLE